VARVSFGSRVRVGSVWEHNASGSRFMVRNVYRKDRSVLILWLSDVSDPLAPPETAVRSFQFMRDFCRQVVWNQEDVDV
jgi:hypothetical protein